MTALLSQWALDVEADPETAVESVGIPLTDLVHLIHEVQGVRNALLACRKHELATRLDRALRGERS